MLHSGFRQKKRGFESFSRCQNKGDPAVVETAGFLVISSGLGDFDIENIFSILFVFEGFETGFFDDFTVLFTFKNVRVIKRDFLYRKFPSP